MFEHISNAFSICYYRAFACYNSPTIHKSWGSSLTLQATQVYSFEQTGVWAPANPQAIAQSVVFRCILRGVISVLIYGVEKENICFFKFIGYLHKIKFLKVKKKKINYSLVTHLFPGFAVTCGWDFKLPVKNAWCLQWTNMQLQLLT